MSVFVVNYAFKTSQFNVFWLNLKHHLEPMRPIIYCVLTTSYENILITCFLLGLQLRSYTPTTFNSKKTRWFGIQFVFFLLLSSYHLLVPKIVGLASLKLVFQIFLQPHAFCETTFEFRFG